MRAPLQLIPLDHFPLVEPGDDLARLTAESLQANALHLEEGDVLVFAQKVVSKSENRYRRLSEVNPSARATALAEQADKDARLVELILGESSEVVRVRPGVMIVEHHSGCVLANAGIDRSNIQSEPDDPRVLLLPEDPDRSARTLRIELGRLTGVTPQVVINDSVGRAWRNGTVGIAIGCAGMDPLHNQIGHTDLFGNVLEVTEPAVADELAAAASLVMGQAAEGCPVVLARGFSFRHAEVGSSPLLREKSLDMFR
jgi:coenzyme F420-0:L-glutamate ligase/coenzyme F420-1:gamma-L-glutamate ligase